MSRSVLTLLVVACLVVPARADDVAPRPTAITELKPLYPRTVLVENGEARSFIVIPEGRDYLELAEKLQGIVENATSAKLPIKRATELVNEDWRIDFNAIAGRNMIALGNVNNNRLLSVLYGERYVVADSIYPGKGGHVVRTVHDPFAKGVNVLVLAGSDPAGADKAITVFRDNFMRPRGKTVVLGAPAIDVVFQKKAYRFFPDATHHLSSKRQPQYTGMAWFEARLKEGGFMDEKGEIVRHKGNTTLVALTGMIARIGQTYFRRGDRELLPLMKELLDKNRHLLKNPAKVHGMGGRTAGHVREWDLLEELPIWTDQDRLDVTNALLRDASLGHERRAFHGQVKSGCVQALDENHGTNSALKSFHAWHYFHKYYPSAASEYWMKCASAVFSAQASTHQILEDACGYLAYCPKHAENYALAARDLRYFKRGVAFTHAQYMSVACINNLGLGTGFGDSSGIVYPGIFEAIAPAAWLYRAPRLYWVLRKTMPPNAGLRIFQSSIAMDLEVEPRVPTEWTGLIRIPLYEAPLAKGNAVKTPVFAEKKDVDPKLFNKLVFKENWDPEGQYLLLDGAGVWAGPPGPHGHKHNDINTIINFTSHGRMWLVDHTYQVRAPQDHSGLFVTRSGRGGYRKRTLARLKSLFQARDYGLSRTQFVNTDRAIFWKKGRYFLVVDQAVADSDGDYFARCSFRALGEAEVRDDALWLSQKGRFCKIVSDGEANLDLERYEYANRPQWEGFYPHAKPVVKIFQEDKSRTLEKGETIGFINLLYGYADGKERDDVRMLPVSETCALVVDGGEKAFAGVGKGTAGIGVADMFLVSDDAVIALGTKSLLDGLVSVDAACDVFLNMPRRELRVRNQRPTRLTLERGEGRATLALDSGDHTIPLRDWDGIGRARSAIRKAIAAAETEARKREKRDAGEHKSETHGFALKTVKLQGAITRLIVADVDGGEDEWVVATEQGVASHRQDGARLWAFDTAGPVRSLDVGDLDGDGRTEIVAGCDDHHVYMLDSKGKQQWTFKCKTSQGSLDGPPRVDYVKIADLEGDGKQEIVVGANWVHVLDAEGKLKWEKYMAYRRGRISGDFVCGHVGDLDHNGAKEIVALFMTSYPVLQVFDRDGNVIVPKKPGAHGGINIDVPIAATVLDVFGSQQRKQIVYCGRSRLGLLWHDHKVREPGGGYYLGSFVAMTSFQADPTQRPILVAADTVCGVVGVKPRPERKDRWIRVDRIWYRGLGEKIGALLAADVNGDGQGEVYVGTRNGSVHVLNVAEGKTLGSARLSHGRLNAFTHDPKRKRMLAATDGGVVLCLTLASPSPR